MIEKITKIICEHTGNNDSTITEDTVLIADLGLNSLELVNLACIVEDEFDIEIPDRAIKDFKTVGDVIAFIEKQWRLNNTQLVYEWVHESFISGDRNRNYFPQKPIFVPVPCKYVQYLNLYFKDGNTH